MTQNGIYIRKMRENSGMTQSEVAEKIGVSLRTYQRYEEKGNIKIAQLHQLQEILLNDTPKNDIGHIEHDTYAIPKITSVKASAGKGNELEGIATIDDDDKTMHLDRAFFKNPPSKNTRIMQVDGYSMIPMLLPDSWVIFNKDGEFKGDGLYVIRYCNQVMVKLLQIKPNRTLKVISRNPDYESFEINFTDNQDDFEIFGKVIRSIV